MTAPLSGIKVIEIGTLIAAPFAARLMAEFGAEVIKIEAMGQGDPLRKWRKLHEGTSPSASGLGYCRTPAIYTPAQIAAWKAVTDSGCRWRPVLR